MANKVAPEGQIYVCNACGKTSKDLYGEDSDYGWDESCSMHAVLCYSQKRFGAGGIYSWQAVPTEIPPPPTPNRGKNMSDHDPDSGDIVERLKSAAEHQQAAYSVIQADDLIEAAKEIETLRSGIKTYESIIKLVRQDIAIRYPHLTDPGRS